MRESLTSKVEAFKPRLAKAINEALSESADLSEVIEDLKSEGLALDNLHLEMQVSLMPVKVPVPVLPSVDWLERLFRLKDTRD